MSGRAPIAPFEGERAPDLFEPLLGYRFWRVGWSGALRCLVGRERWGSGLNRASCWRPSGHDAPGKLCTCGFNALHELPERSPEEYHRTVLGAIAAWGAVEVHRGGFRAQYARVIALVTPAPHPARRLRRAAERYGVPLVPLAALPEVAERYARRVDPALLPAHRSHRSARR